MIRAMLISDAEPVARLAGQLGYPTSAAEIRQRFNDLLLQSGTAINLKLYADHSLRDWKAGAENPYWILDTVEMKTAWHPIGL